MLKILSVFGTRPEAVKMAPVVRELAARPSEIISRVCVTAQHRQMLDQVLHAFGIVPDVDLNLMQPGQTLSQSAAAVLKNMEPVLLAEKPDWVLVQGDTTTVMAAALAAFYCGARVGHVEAGLRSFDKYQPFPEEINRKVAGAIADLHFAPTERSKQNLLREGVPENTIVVTGNTEIDALQWAITQPVPDEARALLNRVEGRKLVLVTAHRRENFGKPFEEIFGGLRDLAKRYAEQAVILYPVHLNPNVQEPARRILGDAPNVILTDPLDYLPLIHVMRRAALVLTDSGGIQESAPSLGKPVLVLRDKTERPEAVDAGTVRLVGADRARIVAEASRLLDDFAEYAAMARAINPYGDGHAAPRIVDALIKNS
ncbi:MAG TPA: UDP-N-acetylglucosamine 2-epimerase (non-hydrolyzing) [Thermoflexales bacterium]|nr:UDP-N-acetylglucosamine 2-epimerase (non-hydrolyzing) [Thermoflexales bacterium]HQW34002.1 UDP-N-acetylglucosamine 2-epimerase (non-hydrolyzing) [Thermoflexales bacterium]HQZ99156.1 UDP-N-acetylglucosamine 2-epimerase (non-hydrolyzing) [Thermoflexales bacterium]